jgi:hypothetical protein
MAVAPPAEWGSHLSKYPQGEVDQMRRLILGAIGAAAAIVVMTPMAASAATTDVLTITKVGGTNVAVGAKLSASLKSGTDVVFSDGSAGSISCAKSSFTESVTTNPAKPGTATLSITAQSYSDCKATIDGIKATVKSVTAYKLPYKVTVSDAKGLPVTVTKPGATVVASADGVTATCTYQAAKITGSADNTGSAVAFKDQELKVVTGSSSLCPASGDLTVTYAPVEDTSVKGDPHVFVN